jgi:hypothetical protein
MVTITHALNDTGFGEMPTDKELASLLKIVLAAHADIARAAAPHVDFAEQFRNAFLAVGYLFRLDQPNSKRFFSAFVEDAGEWLVRLGRAPVSGPAFLAAVIAHGDVPFRKADEQIGQLLEVGLDPYSGRRCKRGWRDILRGERSLLPPTPPPSAGRHPSEYAPRPRIYQEDSSGNMQPIGDRPLWSR